MATLKEVADGIVELGRKGHFVEAVDRYYARDALSVESADFGLGLEQRGIDAIRNKNIWWGDNHDVHAITIDGPFIGSGRYADRFALHFVFDLTPKATGKRFTFKEMGLYTVKNGKVVREEFFYPAA